MRKKRKIVKVYTPYLWIALTVIYLLMFNSVLDFERQNVSTLLSTLITGMIALWGLFNVVYLFLFEEFRRMEKDGKLDIEKEINFQTMIKWFNFFLFSAIFLGIITFSELNKDYYGYLLLLTVSLATTSITLVFIINLVIIIGGKEYLEKKMD